MLKLFYRRWLLLVVTTLNFEQVLQRGIPFMVILGEKEVQQGVVQLKDMTKHTQEVGREERVAPEHGKGVHSCVANIAHFVEV